MQPAQHSRSNRRTKPSTQASIVQSERTGQATSIFAGIVMVVGAGFFLTCGCAQFQSIPLSGGVTNSLSPEMQQGMRAKASSIQHPILHPVRLNLHNGLSADEAGVIAVLANPSLRAIRDDRQLADAQLLQAGLLPNPQVSAGYGLPMGGDSSRVDAYGLGLSWDVTSQISRCAKLEGARDKRARVDLDIAWKEWQVAQAAKIAVWRVVALENQVALAKDACQFLDEEKRVMTQAIARGSATSRQLAAVKAASRQAHQDQLEVEKKLAAQRIELNRLLGAQANATYTVSRSPGLPVKVDVPSVDSLCRKIDGRRLDLLALRRGYDSQQAAVRAAILEQFPKVNIGATRDRDTDNLNTVGFQFGIELPLFDRNQARIASARATRQKLRDEYTNRVFQARTDVAMLVSAIQFLNRQIAEVRAANTDFNNLAETYKRALNDGRVDAITTLDARARLVKNRQTEITLRGQLAEATCALELATGLYRIPSSHSF